MSTCAEDTTYLDCRFSVAIARCGIAITAHGGTLSRNGTAAFLGALFVLLVAALQSVQSSRPSILDSAELDSTFRGQKVDHA